MNEPHESPYEKIERPTIQIDIYGVVKGEIVPTEPPASGAKSWKKVFKNINHSLISIVESVFGLPATTLVSVRRLIAGIGALPRESARKVDRAHDRADRLESTQQQELANENGKRPDRADAVENLATVLTRLMDVGIQFQIRQSPDGTIYILAVGQHSKFAEQLIQSEGFGDDNREDGGSSEHSDKLARRVEFAIRKNALIRDLRVELRPGQVVLKGRAATDLVKQTATHAALDSCEDLVLVNEIEVY